MENESKKNKDLESRELEPHKAEKMKRTFPDETFYLLGPGRYLMREEYKTEAEKIYNLEIRPSDVFVVTFPRSGTTWTQELVWLVVNDLDFASSDLIPLCDRYKIVELSSFLPRKINDELAVIHGGNEENLKILRMLAQSTPDLIVNDPSPRFIKTHVPLPLLSPNLLDTAKVVYVARDPRDVAVSYYYLYKNLNFNLKNDFRSFWDMFINDLVLFAPYFEHVKSAWEKRDHPNMLFLFYEELSQDLAATIRRVANFFEKEFTEDQIARLCEHLSFENCKKNKTFILHEFITLDLLKKSESFIRRGKMGGWRDYFDEDMTEQAERWMEENLRDTDLRFPQPETE